MRSLIQDARFAVRTLRRRPTFTAVTVVTLALGIGATTAIFSVVDSVLLRPLAFRDSGSLVAVSRTYPRWLESDVLRKDWDRIAFSYPGFLEWRGAQTSFSDAGAWGSWFGTITGGDRPEMLTGFRVSPSLLSMLGVQPIIGRLFFPEDGTASAPRVALISAELWASRFGSDRAIVGRTVRFDETPYTIVGVVPPRTNLTGQGNPPSVWVAAGSLPQDQSARNYQFRVVARLRPNVSLQQAELETVRLVRGTADPSELGARLAVWRNEITKGVRTPLLILLGASALLLVIACGNVAMLLLGESATRESEMAARLALGAGRGRLVRQLITESLILALVGSALGALLALGGTKALVAAAPAQLPRLYDVAVDMRVLGFSLACAIATGVLFSVFPALSLVTTSPAALLGTASRSASRRRGYLQRALVAVELALCVTLLVSAGLLSRSLGLLVAVDPGFRPENLAVVKVGIPRSWYPDSTRVRAFYSSVIERMSALPGVDRVSSSSGAPFDLSTASTTIQIEGRPASDSGLTSEYRTVMPDYFETVGVPLLAGRAIDATDRTNGTGTLVVNATFARRAWPNESAIGKRARYDDDWRTVVGVVGDIHNAGLDADPQPMFYVSALQENAVGQRFVIRSRVALETLAPELRRAVAAADPAIPVTSIDGMPTLVSRSVAEPRYRAALISLFALVAGLLATVGVYGVTARAVSQQSREIGIRMALGSTGSAVTRLFVSRTMVGVGIGVVIGGAGAFAASRLLAPYLFGITPSDPLTFGGVVALLIVVGVAASWLPARVASRTNPAVVLRRT